MKENAIDETQDGLRSLLGLEGILGLCCVPLVAFAVGGAIAGGAAAGAATVVVPMNTTSVGGVLVRLFVTLATLGVVGVGLRWRQR